MTAIAVTEDIAACLRIRETVFTGEQGVSREEDVDGRDPEAIHLLATRDGIAIGTARILIKGEVGKIGRVAVLKETRGLGIGRDLMLSALDQCRAQGLTRATLGAQTHALAFYEALGFTAIGPEFLDAGIPHREMVVEL